MKLINRTVIALNDQPLLTSAIICTTGLLATVIGFWPGVVPFDGVRQYCQVITHSYNTWHPVAMVAWWSLLNRVYAGPAPMLLFQLFLYWGALLLFTDALRRLKLPGVWCVCLLGFSPFLLNFAGVILKDTQFAVSWAFAYALIFHAYVRESRLGFFGATAVFALLAYGFLVRTNAAVALFPLLGFAVYIQFRCSWPRLLFGVAVAAAAIFAFGPIVDRSMEAKKHSGLSAALLYDIAGIAVRCGEQVLPEYVLAHPEYSWEKLCDSYTLDSVVPLIVSEKKRQLEIKDIKWWAEGPRLNTSLAENIETHAQEIRLAWFSAVAHHPLAYVKHRMALLRSFLRFGAARPYLACLKTSDFPEFFGWTYKPNLMGRVLWLGIIDSIIVIPSLFKPYFWLALAVFWCLVLRKYQGSRPVRVGAMTLIFSAVLYLAPYVLISQAADFRYAYWTVWATAMASAMLLLDMIHRRSLGCHRAGFLAGLAVVASLLLADLLLVHITAIVNMT